MSKFEEASELSRIESTMFGIRPIRLHLFVITFSTEHLAIVFLSSLVRSGI